MGEDKVDDVEEVPNGMESVVESTNEGNPAWQELYDVLPEGFNKLVEPTLSKWDKSTQAKFQANAEAQKVYEPYQRFVDESIGSDQIDQALNIAQMIDSDPKAFMKQMQEYFGEEAVQDPAPKAPVETDTSEYGDYETKSFDLSTDPSFKKLQEQQDIIAGFLQKQVEAEESAKADVKLETQLTELTTKYGAFDEDYVFGLAVNEVPLEDAVKRYHAMVETIRTRPAADANLPNILTPGGGLPSEQINPADMDKKQRMAYMVNALTQANKT